MTILMGTVVKPIPMAGEGLRAQLSRPARPSRSIDDDLGTETDYWGRSGVTMANVQCNTKRLWRNNIGERGWSWVISVYVPDPLGPTMYVQ